MDRLMLDVCCGPCSTHVIETLKEAYDLILIYPNSNIYPKEEYVKRLAEAKKMADLHGLKLVEVKYDHDDWCKYIQSKVKNPENEPEGGKRCEFCFRYRLEQTARIAKEHGIKYFTTTLTVSPHKDEKLINRIGKEIQNKYGIIYSESNFKKKDGYRKSIELSHKYNLYRQKYCGCEFSK